jgi:hypothetical protein
LLADIQAEEKLTAERNVVGGTRTGSTANLPDLIRKGMALLKKLDGLVASMIKDQTFIQTYQSLRLIYDRRGGKGGDKEEPKAII